MGLQNALGITETDLPMEIQIEWHLQHNHFPPIPAVMVHPCLKAIEAYWEGDTMRNISLPEGVGYKGLTVAPAWAILEQHHLEAWTAVYDYDAAADYLSE